MTIYTKVSTVSSSYTPREDYGFLYDSLAAYDDHTRKYDGGKVANYSKEGDVNTNYGPIGLLLFLATEDDNYLMEENSTTYLIVRDYGTYTKRADITTPYTKVADV